MKILISLLFLICLAMSDFAYAQNNKQFEKDSLQVPVRLTFEKINDSMLLNFDSIDPIKTHEPGILQRNEVLGLLEFGRSILDQSGTTFIQDFRPMSVSEYNYSINQQRLTGQIPFRRTTTFGIFQFN